MALYIPAAGPILIIINAVTADALKLLPEDQVNTTAINIDTE